MPDPVLRSRLLQATLLIAAMVHAAACTDRPESGTASSENTFVITARGLELDAPAETPSGWITFRFVNESSMAHFALIERMPEGVGIDDQQLEVAPVFQRGMDLLQRGSVDSAMAVFGDLPEWFGKVKFMGGPGLLAAGRSTETTVYLDPGSYLVECYVKTNGIFHSYNPDPDEYGMVHQFRVTSDSSGTPEPHADIKIVLSGERGINMSSVPTTGRQTFSVRFEDQTVHENFVGHDLHLARLEDDTDFDALAMWMDWTRPGGLETPAPVQFLGGTNEMPAGSTAYFSTDLAPGRYALISEVPRSREKGLFEVVSIPAR